MPAEFAIHTTGHDCRLISAFFEYLDANRALSMIGGCVLAGWPATPYGQPGGDGPVPASLQPILNLGVDCNGMDRFISHLFRLDSASPPVLRKSGKLWPAVKVAAATLIMYYKQRCEAGEMLQVRNAMQESLKHGIPPVCAGTNSHQVLISWSALVADKFNEDNLHLTCRASSDANTQLSAVTQQMGQVISELRSLVLGLQSEVTRIKQDAMDLQNTRSPGSHASASASTQAASASTQATAFSFLMQQGPHDVSASPGMQSFAGVTAAELYLDYMRRGGNMPNILKKQDLDRAKIAVRWFDAFATEDEHTMLKDNSQETGRQRICCMNLNVLCVARIVQAYREAKMKDNSVKIPDLKGTTLLVGAIQNRKAALEKLGVTVDVDVQAFATFRKQYEADKRQSVVSKRVRESDAP